MRRHINPESMFKPAHYTQVISTSGSRLVFVSGQVAFDANGHVTGVGDLEAQARQAYQNLGTALAAAGTAFSDVVKITTYVVGYRPEHAQLLRDVRASFIGSGQPPTATLVGVQALARPELLFEVDAIAVVGA